jgi:disulfide bond formation protein DsbB
VSCTEAAFRVLGLSMAGWNVVVSLALAGFAAAATGRSPFRQASDIRHSKKEWVDR